MPTALTIAGSDSIAGAGVQADLKTFAALGVYGVSAVTAVTAQNTSGVAEIFTLPSRIVQAQIEEMTRDVQISAVKTGMLASAEIVQAVSEALEPFERMPVVVDPVMASGGTARRTLLAPEAVSILKTRLLPLATVVTPNVAEAEALCDVRVDSIESARRAARRIAELGAAAVVVKGGHLSGSHAVDVLFHAGTLTEIEAPRMDLGPIHGMGCTFASAIAAGLALGDDIPAAVHRAKRYITGAIQQSFAIGRGARILNHFWRPPPPR